MAKSTVLYTQTQYAFWLDAAKERYGHNIPDWPAGVRAYHNKIELVEEVRIELVQSRIPYSNTGVTTRGNAKK